MATRFLIRSWTLGAAWLMAMVNVPSTAGTAPAAGKLRILASPSSISGWMRTSAVDTVRGRILAERRSQLDFYAALGFTHVVYPVDVTAISLFARAPNGHVYNHGRHEGDADSSFRAMKQEVEKRGMRLIPQVNALSHMDAFITWVDSTVSEFSSRAAFDSFCVAKGIPRNRDLDHVAAALDNPGADRIFTEFLGIVKANWGSTPLGGRSPSHILIGHDELGYDSVCFIKQGRSRHRPESPSRLVAMEVARRASQTDSVLGGSPDILLFGDSFLPTDLGERYGLAGSPRTGKGGVLAILAESKPLRERLIIVPWNYLLAEGESHYWSRLPYSRSRQLALLDTLGIRYVLGTGEHGSNAAAKEPWTPPFAIGNLKDTQRSIFEWVKASQSHRKGLAGYAHQTFEPFGTCSPSGVCVGYTAPLLAYLAWSPASPIASSPASLKGKAYHAGFFRGLDHVRSRRDLKWVEGVHYPRPAGLRSKPKPGSKGPSTLQGKRVAHEIPGHVVPGGP